MGKKNMVDDFSDFVTIPDIRNRVQADGKWGYANISGEIVIPCRFEEAGFFDEGPAAVKLNGKWGYIDEKGNMVVEPKYQAE